MVSKQLKLLLVFVLMLAVVSGAVSAASFKLDVSVSPSSPKTTDTLNCLVKVSTGNDTYTYNVDYVWNDGNDDVDTGSFALSNGGSKTLALASSVTEVGKTYKCTAVATDNDNDQKTTSASKLISNQKPDVKFSSGDTLTVEEDKPEEFLLFDLITVADLDPEHQPEEEKLTYIVTSSDTSKVTCSLSGNDQDQELKVTPAKDFNTDSLTSSQFPTCTVTASDGFDTDNVVFEVEVEGLNDAPVITGLSTTSVSLGSTFGATVSATHPDENDALTFTLVTGPTGMTLSTAGKFNWKPTVIGDFPVTVSAQDTQGSKSTKDFTVKVTETHCVSLKDVDGTVSGGGNEDLAFSSGGISGSLEPRPGSKFTIEFELENTCSDDQKDADGKTIDNDAECSIDLELEELCDDCDNEDQDKDVDVDAEKDEKAEFTFDIPAEADQGSYDLEVTITCDDKDGPKNYDLFNGTVDVSVEKETHELFFREVALAPSLVSCVRKPSLTVEVANIGDKDEDVELVISNAELGIQINEFFDLQEGDILDDDETLRRKTYSLNIDDSVKPGNYQIEVDAYYNANKDTEEEFVTLVVQECGSEGSSSSSNSDDDEESSTKTGETANKPVQTVVTVPSTVTSPVKAQPASSNAATLTSDSKSSGSWVLILLVVGIVVVLGIISLLLVAAFRK